MKTGVVGGLTVLALFGAGAWSLKQGVWKLPEPTAPKTATLPAGARVPLVLAEGLTSGGAKVGQTVSLLLTEDLMLGKVVVAARGHRVLAEVTKSRGSTPFTQVGNQPARLEITLKPLETSDGQTIELHGTDGAVVVFSQENTAGRRDAAKIDRLWETPEGKASLEAIRGNGLNPPSPEALRKVADAVGMRKTKQFLDSPRGNGDASAPDKLLGAVVKGDLMGLSGIDQVLAVQALGEIASVGKAVDDKLRGVFKGNNIEAVVGTPVGARTAQKHTVRLP